MYLVCFYNFAHIDAFCLNQKHKVFLDKTDNCKKFHYINIFILERYVIMSQCICIVMYDGQKIRLYLYAEFPLILFTVYILKFISIYHISTI